MIMKQFFMMLAAMLFISSAALAQDKSDNRKEGMVKHRTERMVKEYGLNDSQAKQLLELNTKYVDAMRPMHRHGRPGRHGMRGQHPDGMTGATKAEKPDTLKAPKAPRGNMKKRCARRWKRR